MENKPLDLSKKSLPSTSESDAHFSEKDKESAKEGNHLRPDQSNLSHVEGFSSSDGNNEGAFEQKSKISVQTNIENESLELRHMVSGSRLGIKRKINTAPLTNPGANSFKDLGSGSDRKKSRKIPVVSDCNERTEADFMSIGPSTSTGSTNSIYPIPSTSACAISRYDSASNQEQSSNTNKKLHLHCKYCSRSCRSSSEYARHVRSHTGEQPFKCDRCNKGFSDKSNLKRHISTHNKERPFVCEKCNKAFTTRHNLLVHNRSHTGARPFACKECNDAFSTSSNLNRHNRRHTGERPICLTCRKTFTKKSDLKRHENTHNGKPKET